MNTIQQSIIIPEDRHLRLDLALPENIPAGKAELLLVLSPIKTAQEKQPKKSVLHLAGRLASSATFAGDPVALQKAIRDEW